ncbi:MAG: hypothetical protein PT977_09935 [Acidobacteriota bacterium]|nr:hypothetical protein [Acidobacteriota bacterium]
MIAALLLAALSSDALFAEGPEGSRNLVIVGRYLAADETRISLAAAFLARGAARLRAEGTADPGAEVLLGEVAERLAPKGGAAPAGVGFVQVFDPKAGRRFRAYDGAAFRRVLDDIPQEADTPLAEVRERAMAGALRARFPLRGTSLLSLWEETVLWLTFAERVKSPSVAEGVARKLEAAAPSLARLLLAAERGEDLTALDRRLTDAAERLEALEPSPGKARRLREAARAVRRLRGNGGPSFPQEVWVTQGPAALVARIDGEIGKLSLVTEAHASAPAALRSAPRAILDSPLLPVPGSLALGADGQTVTWLEAATPTSLVRVAARLDGSGRVPFTDTRAQPRRAKK